MAEKTYRTLFECYLLCRTVNVINMVKILIIYSGEFVTEYCS